MGSQVEVHQGLKYQVMPKRLSQNQKRNWYQWRLDCMANAVCDLSQATYGNCSIENQRIALDVLRMQISSLRSEIWYELQINK